MTDLEKARKWASDTLEDFPSPHEGVVARLIQSLPDRWVDVEKLREVVSKYEGNTYISEIVQDFADLLPVPKLPTLADMTAEERAACKWMQARVYDNDGTVVLLSLNEARQSAKYLCPGKEVGSREYSAVTPLPDLPKLEWPGNEVVETSALPEGMRLADHEKFGRVVASPWGDVDDDYKIFFLNEDARGGADYDFAHESRLTFLDGGQHV